MCAFSRVCVHCARQIAKFSQIYDADDVAETLIPIALRLCRDPVASVRKAAVGQIGLLVQLNSGRERCVEGVCELAVSPSCHDRKMYVSLSGVCMCWQW
jgi:hypothetical protein